MKPIDFDITIYQGSTFIKVIQWRVGAYQLPVDLGGYTARMQIRKRAIDSTLLDELTTENGGLSIDQPTSEGKIRINISASRSSAYNFTSGVYDLEVKSADNVTAYRILQGYFDVIPEVTR